MAQQEIDPFSEVEEEATPIKASLISLPPELRLEILKMAIVPSYNGKGRGIALTTHLLELRIARRKWSKSVGGRKLYDFDTRPSEVCKTLNNDVNAMIFPMHTFEYTIDNARPHRPRTLAYLPLVQHAELKVDKIDFADCDIELGMLETFSEHLGSSEKLETFQFVIHNPRDELLRRRWNVAMVLQLRKHKDAMAIMSPMKQELCRLKFVVDVLKDGKWKE